MNTVSLLGRMTKDVELKENQNGTKYINFCIAVDEGKDTTYFIDCKAWSNLAENISKYFKKGDKIAVTGHLTTRMWEDDNAVKRKITEVNVRSFDFCNSKDKTGSTDNNDRPDTTEPADVESELPFEC